MQSEQVNVKKLDVKPEKKLLGVGIAAAIFGIIWGLVGIAAFITSLVCFGKSGSTTEKIIGFVLAIFFGPFYFIYLGVNKEYCR